jgi:hypothetical protein
MQFFDGKFALGKNGKHGLADGSGCAYDGDSELFHDSPVVFIGYR